MLIAPVLVTGWWFYSTLQNRDPRKAVPAAAFQIRPADKPVQPLVPFRQPVVSVTFDDGWESAYTNAFPLLQQDGFHTTQYIISGELTNNAYMSAGQLRAMQQTGTEIASHTVDHPDLTTLNAGELDHELKDSQSTLERLFGGRVQDFTSPYGAYNVYTLHQIGLYYRSQKNAEGDASSTADPLRTINTAANFNPLNFPSFSVRNTTTAADIQRLIDEAVKTNGWLVLTYHQVDNSGGEFAVTPAVFKQQLDLIRNSPMRSATVGQMMDALAASKKAGQ